MNQTVNCSVLWGCFFFAVYKPDGEFVWDYGLLHLEESTYKPDPANRRDVPEELLDFLANLDSSPALIADASPAKKENEATMIGRLNQWTRRTRARAASVQPPGTPTASGSRANAPGKRRRAASSDDSTDEGRQQSPAGSGSGCKHCLADGLGEVQATDHHKRMHKLDNGRFCHFCVIPFGRTKNFLAHLLSKPHRHRGPVSIAERDIKALLKKKWSPAAQIRLEELTSYTPASTFLRFHPPAGPADYADTEKSWFGTARMDWLAQHRGGKNH